MIGEKLSHCPFVFHTSHMVRSWIELALCGERLVTNHLNQGTQESEGSFLSSAPLISEKALVFGKFLGSPLVSAPFRNVEHWWTDSEGKVEVLGENPVSTPRCRPEISHDLPWDRTGPLR